MFRQDLAKFFNEILYYIDIIYEQRKNLINNTYNNYFDIFQQIDTEKKGTINEKNIHDFFDKNGQNIDKKVFKYLIQNHFGSQECQSHVGFDYLNFLKFLLLGQKTNYLNFPKSSYTEQNVVKNILVQQVLQLLKCYEMFITFWENTKQDLSKKYQSFSIQAFRLFENKTGDNKIYYSQFYQLLKQNGYFVSEYSFLNLLTEIYQKKQNFIDQNQLTIFLQAKSEIETFQDTHSQYIFRAKPVNLYCVKNNKDQQNKSQIIQDINKCCNNKKALEKKQSQFQKQHIDKKQAILEYYLNKENQQNL